MPLFPTFWPRGEIKDENKEKKKREKEKGERKLERFSGWVHIMQGGRGHWTVNYTSTQRFTTA